MTIDLAVPDLEIGLRGPLRLTLSDGRDATPKSRKAQGLIALLAMTPGMRRPRRWLEDKLWSDRGAEQASASLRQALTEIRRGLGDALVADRVDVALDPRRVRVLEEPPGRPLLEGLDVRDPEFEDWLRLERARADPPPEAPMAPLRPLVLRTHVVEGGGSPTAGFLGALLSDQVARLVTDQVSGWVQSEGVGAAAAADIVTECRVAESGGTAILLLRAVHAATRRVLHSAVVRVAATGAELLHSDALVRASFDIAEKVLIQLPLVEADRAEVKGAALARRALDRMFTFERPGLEEAERLLRAAFDIDGRGTHLAWRALIRTIGMVERFSADVEALRDESEMLIRHTLELAGDNAVALAILSQVRTMQFGDAEGASELASLALERNPGSAFAWEALAVARMLAGDHAEALRLSRIGRNGAGGSRHRHWWEVFHAIVCLSAGRYDEAFTAAEASLRGAPAFRPAHRHLIALHAQRGDEAAAQRQIARLVTLEPDFTLDRMLNDHEYPVRSLRRTPLLGLARKLLL